MSDTPQIVVRFGQLPIGAWFTVIDRERNPRDRRRYLYVPHRYFKSAQGSIGGFGIGTAKDDRRFNHHDRVAIDANDLRLVTLCATNQSHARIEAPHVA